MPKNIALINFINTCHQNVLQKKIKKIEELLEVSILEDFKILSLSSLKLHNIIYFLYGIYYYWARQKKFRHFELIIGEIEFIAIPNGIKIVPLSYNIISSNKSSSLDYSTLYDEKEIIMIKKIINNLLSYSNENLIFLIFCTSPWQQAIAHSTNRKIDKETIKNHFIKNGPLYFPNEEEE